MKVYETTIEVYLDPAFEDARQRNDDLIRRLRILLQKHQVIPEDLATDYSWAQERSLLDFLWHRAHLSYRAASECGYVGSYQNCAFNLLYGLFSIDTIAFLFGQSWIPKTKIHPFDSQDFLERLAVLEQATKKLRDGVKTPVLLPEAKKYFRSGMGTPLACFREEEHRILVESSLRELRGFGELARSLGDATENLRVDIEIWAPTTEDICEDPEIMKFATKVS